MRRRLLALLLAVAPACIPELDERESLVTRTRVLAVRSEPPEALPGEPVTYDLLVATEAGPVAVPAAAFAFCASPKRLTENGAVSAECLRDAGVRSLAVGVASVTAAVPADACFLFGPAVTSPELRPRDPDATGGFYQPVRVIVPEAEAPAFGATRVRCTLASAGAEVAAELARRYVANANPSLLPLEAKVAGAPATFDAIPRGARVALRASWPPSDAESFVSVDVASQRVVPRREAMRVSWFATGGRFDEDRTGRGEEEADAFTETTWTAPSTPSEVHLHAVLRDSRGGGAHATVRALVR